MHKLKIKNKKNIFYKLLIKKYLFFLLNIGEKIIHS